MRQLVLLFLLSGFLINRGAAGGKPPQGYSCSPLDNDNGPLDNLRKFKVVPDVIDFVPEQSIRITYENNVRVREGTKINNIKLTQRPDVRYNSRRGQLYTLMMVDPDIPLVAAPLLSQYLHWMVINIPRDFINDGFTVGNYIQPFAIEPHRYTFLVWEQRGRIEMRELAIVERFKFSARNFAKEHNLKLIAANFVLAGVTVL